MAPRVRATMAAKPSLPRPPIEEAAGQRTVAPRPTVLAHSGLTAVRYSVKLKVVPEPSARCTTVMAWFGKVRPGLMAAMRGSFQLTMRPMNMSARMGPVMRTSPGRKPSRLNMGTVPAMMAGNCTMPSRSSSAPTTGASVAPKATVRARIWRTTAEEPIDW